MPLIQLSRLIIHFIPSPVKSEQGHFPEYLDDQKIKGVLFALPLFQYLYPLRSTSHVLLQAFYFSV